MTPMTLHDLLHRFELVCPTRDGLVLGSAPPSVLGEVVTGIAHDSRRVTTGEVFVAVRGASVDGATFAKQAHARGALAVVSEAAPPPSHGVAWLVVEDARQAMAVLADEVYGHPSEHLTVIGITGTNGKTTTAYLIEAILEAAGIACARLGSVSYRIGDDDQEAAFTTPEATDLQRLMRQMVDRGCQACVMEVSSHALSLRRVDRTRFAAAVFTNLTRDHLDFHGDMESYYLAKRRLFEMLPAEAVAVVNLDDPKGQALLETVGHPMSYASTREADVVHGPVSASLHGLTFDAHTPSGDLHVVSRLVGGLNARNILAAVATCVALKVPLPAIERGIAAMRRVPGRFDIVSDPADEVTVVVDYAHTDDAMKNVLETARPLATARLITVFGCGGDRDRSKRSLMGAVAMRLSDFVIVTSDNPRSEDPQQIVDDVLLGIVPPKPLPSPWSEPASPARHYVTLLDRRAAIERAIDDAAPGDLVVIAGKGHERYQEIQGRRTPFDDAEVATAALEHRRQRDGVGREA